MNGIIYIDLEQAKQIHQKLFNIAAAEHMNILTLEDWRVFCKTFKTMIIIQLSLKS